MTLSYCCGLLNILEGLSPFENTDGIADSSRFVGTIA